MSALTKTLEGLRSRAWEGLSAGAGDAGHPLHTCALATTGPGGAAEARMVVLRRAVRDKALLEIHTDRASRKVADLSARPLATLLFWWPDMALQIRARVRVRIVTGAEIDPVWKALSASARRNYGGRPPPSTPMAGSGDYSETAERDRFALLRGHVETLDLLHLGSAHRRAVYDRRDGFTGGWLAP